MESFALIVAHGQPSDPGPAECDLTRLGERVQTLLPGWHVGTATLAAPGALEAAAAGQAAPLVLPFFMADGWFTRTELPRRLLLADVTDPLILPAFGLWPEVAALARRIVAAALSENAWRADETTLVLAAHGSGRSRAPAEAARRIAATFVGYDDVRLGFIEEAPSLEDTARHVPAQSLCLPLFVARWGHVIEDVPAALAAAGFPGRLLEPIGNHGDVAALLSARIAGNGRDQSVGHD